MSSARDRLDEKALLEKLDELSRPRLAKCKPPSRRERAENRAAQAFRYAIDSLEWSNRKAAGHLKIDERTIRDWMTCARALPAWAPAALPRDGYVAFLSALASDVPDDATEDALDEDGERGAA